MELTILSALIPAGLDLLKQAGGAISRKWFGLSVDDEIKMRASDIDRLKALAELDNPHGTPSQWIIDLRASFRYVSAGVSILAGIYFIGTGVTDLGMQLVSVPFGFIFGERLWMGLKGPNMK
jgi:hypothetical protein